MILRGGVFGKGLGAFSPQDLLISMDPKAGSSPFNKMLQGILIQKGAFKLNPDGVWGQCSHGAFQKVLGVDPSYDSLDQLMGISKYGIPPSNVSIWKPRPEDKCYNGTDAYAAPELAIQDKNPDPALVFGKTFGFAPPAGICTGGGVPNMTTQKCDCPSGTFKNVLTGLCDALEQPGTGSNKLGRPVTSIARADQTLNWQVFGPSKPAASKPTRTLADGASISSNVSAAAGRIAEGFSMLTSPFFKVGGGAAAQPQAAQATGMSAGGKLMVGLVVVGVLGGGVYWMAKRRKKATPNRRRRYCRRYRRNCGE